MEFPAEVLPSELLCELLSVSHRSMMTKIMMLNIMMMKIINPGQSAPVVPRVTGQEVSAAAGKFI